MVIALWAGGRQIETDRGYPFQFASFTEAGRLDADVKRIIHSQDGDFKRIIASSSSWT